MSGAVNVVLRGEGFVPTHGWLLDSKIFSFYQSLLFWKSAGLYVELIGGVSKTQRFARAPPTTYDVNAKRFHLYRLKMKRFHLISSHNIYANAKRFHIWNLYRRHEWNGRARVPDVCVVPNKSACVHIPTYTVCWCSLLLPSATTKNYTAVCESAREKFSLRGSLTVQAEKPTVFIAGECAGRGFIAYLEVSSNTY